MKKDRIHSLDKLYGWTWHVLTVSVRLSLKEGEFRVSTDACRGCHGPCQEHHDAGLSMRSQQRLQRSQSQAYWQGAILLYKNSLFHLCQWHLPGHLSSSAWKHCIREIERGKSGSVHLWGNCRVGTTQHSWTWSHSAREASAEWETGLDFTDIRFPNWHLHWCSKQSMQLDSHFIAEKPSPLGPTAISENKDVRRYDREKSFHILPEAVSKWNVLHYIMYSDFGQTDLFKPRQLISLGI